MIIGFVFAGLITIYLGAMLAGSSIKLMETVRSHLRCSMDGLYLGSFSTLCHGYLCQVCGVFKAV